MDMVASGCGRRGVHLGDCLEGVKGLRLMQRGREYVRQSLKPVNYNQK